MNIYPSVTNSTHKFQLTACIWEHQSINHAKAYETATASNKNLQTLHEHPKQTGNKTLKRQHAPPKDPNLESHPSSPGPNVSFEKYFYFFWQTSLYYNQL
jgi:hypothetical protein